jgi:hypothetical protein
MAQLRSVERRDPSAALRLLQDDMKKHLPF